MDIPPRTPINVPTQVAIRRAHVHRWDERGWGLQGCKTPDRHRVLCNVRACRIPAQDELIWRDFLGNSYMFLVNGMSTATSSSDLCGSERQFVTSTECLSAALSRVPITRAAPSLHGLSPSTMEAKWPGAAGQDGCWGQGLGEQDQAATTLGSLMGSGPEPMVQAVVAAGSEKEAGAGAKAVGLGPRLALEWWQEHSLALPAWTSRAVKSLLCETLATRYHIPLLLCISMSFKRWVLTSAVSINKPCSFLTIKSRFKQGEFHTSSTKGC